MNRVQLLGTACLVGGLMWFTSGLVTMAGSPALDTETGGVTGDLFFALTNVCLMGGALGLLAIHMRGAGWARWVGFIGALLTLLAQGSYIGGALYSIAIGQQESELVLASRAGGALLVGLGTLVLGVATVGARQLPGWRRFAPLLVALYYAVMLPIQIVFFIGRGQAPSIALLTFWGLAWAVLGYALSTCSTTAQPLQPATSQSSGAR